MASRIKVVCFFQAHDFAQKSASIGTLNLNFLRRKRVRFKDLSIVLVIKFRCFRCKKTKEPGRAMPTKEDARKRQRREVNSSSNRCVQCATVNKTKILFQLTKSRMSTVLSRCTRRVSRKLAS